MRLFLVSVAVLMPVSLCARAGDWPQFLGPDRTGVAAEKGLAKSWPAEGPKTLWTLDLHEGFGGAAVKDGKVYILDRDSTAQKDSLHCLDLVSGAEQWHYDYASPGKVDYPGPRSTPAVDDKHVYTTGPMGQVSCVDIKTGTAVWSKNVLREFAARMAHWGVAASPLVYKNLLIVAPQGNKAGLAALDKTTGRTVWVSAPIGTMSYASPMVTTIDGVAQVVMIAQECAAGVDARNGKVLWTYQSWGNRVYPIPSVTAIGEDKLFIIFGYGGGLRIIRPQLSGGKWAVEQLVENRNCQSQMHNAVLYDGHLYVNSGTNGRGLVCLDLQGQVLWEHNPPEGKFDNGGDLAIADGMIYCMNGANGRLYLVKAAAEGCQQLGSATVLGRNMVWAPLAIADGKLLCRDQKQLKCLDIRSN